MKKITQAIHRKVGVATFVGILSGIISAIVKFGWEVPFPPRTALRNITNPPQQLLEQLGVPYDITHLTYSFSGYDLPLVSFIVHFAFSIGCAIFYCVAAEYYPKIKLWQGAAFGIFIWIAFHIILMPLMGTIPAPWDQPFDEHFSELFGHIFWMWVIELTRRDLRNRITKQHDAEINLN